MISVRPDSEGLLGLYNDDYGKLYEAKRLAIGIRPLRPKPKYNKPHRVMTMKPSLLSNCD
jgi:hypothetical protein